MLRISRADVDTFGTCDYVSGCFADNSEHTYCYTASVAGAGFQTAAGNSMSNLANQTVFTKNFMSCSGNTDVVFKRIDGIPNVIAQYECQEELSGNRCGRASVTFDGDNLATQSAAVKQHSACHEVGHSGGLAHGGTTDCMRSGYHTNIHYNAHHVSHLNSQF